MKLGETQQFASPEEALAHVGVKGMKWGVRKEDAKTTVSKVGPLGRGRKDKFGRNRRFDQAHISTGSFVSIVAIGPAAFLIPRVREEIKQAGAFNKVVAKERKLAKKDFQWEKKIYTTPSAVQVHNAMADHFNTRIDAINNKPEYKTLDLFKSPDSLVSKKYMTEVDKLTHEGNRLAIKQVHGKSPSGKKMAQLSEDGQSIKIVDADKVEHAVDETIEFRLRRDDRGRILEMNTAEVSEMAHLMDLGADFLIHFGVKGMHWGIRKEDDGPEGVPKKINKMAKADAEEFTRAKLFYGEGAGTRRKLIKAKVEGRTKKDKLYKKAFDFHVAKTDLAKRAEQASKERKRTDVKKSIKKTGKGVGHVVRGNSQYANTAAVAGVAAAGYAHRRGLDRKAINVGKDFVNRYVNTR